MGFDPVGRKLRTLAALFLILLATASATQDSANEETKVHPRLHKYKASRRLPPKPSKPKTKPPITNRLVGCTTLVLASFPAHCKAFVPGTPGCDFSFRQHGVRELYDCEAVASLPASAYIDGRPQGLEPIGLLDYSFDNVLGSKGGELAGAFAVSSLQSSCGTVEYVGRMSFTPQRGATVFGFKWLKSVKVHTSGAIADAKPKSFNLATGGFIRQSTTDPPIGYSLLAVKATLMYEKSGPNLPLTCDTTDASALTLTPPASLITYSGAKASFTLKLTSPLTATRYADLYITLRPIGTSTFTSLSSPNLPPGWGFSSTTPWEVRSKDAWIEPGDVYEFTVEFFLGGPGSLRISANAHALTGRFKSIQFNGLPYLSPEITVRPPP